MSDYRSPQVLLQEAELMASSPEIVADWLKTQDVRFFNFGRDDDLEHRLLGRESPLIDLALARFGICNDVLGNLFLRNDEVFRIATLSNENIIKASILFDWRFVTNSDSFDWIASLKQSELSALFANSKLPDHVISDFFDGKSAWPHLSEDHRLVAVDAMTENLIARSDRRDSWDGWADYSYSKVFDSAWSFSERADVNFKWAFRLGRLYRELMPRTFSDFKPLSVAKKWYVPADDAERLKREAEDNERGYLGNFQEVRCGLARLAASKDWRDTEVRERILENSDMAIRCGGYLVFEFSAAEINRAWKRDNKIAARHLLSNDRVWKTADLRDALREVCSLASKGDDYVVSLSAEYSRRDDQIRETNADWFRDEDSLFIDDAPYGTADPVSEHLESLGQRLAALQNEVRAISWGLLILLVVGITRLF